MIISSKCRKHINELAHTHKVEVKQYRLYESLARYNYETRQIDYDNRVKYKYISIMHEFGHLITIDTSPERNLNTEYLVSDVLNQEAYAWKWAFDHSITRVRDDWKLFAAECMRTYHRDIYNDKTSSYISNMSGVFVPRSKLIEPNYLYWRLINHPRLPYLNE